MIEATALTKRYGATTAVNELTFTARSGRVTGFLGPNGAGKSTTMRLILGLDTPDAGTVLVDGVPYRQLKDPLRTVGAMLDATWRHPAAAGATTCAGWPRPTASRTSASKRCWRWSG